MACDGFPASGGYLAAMEDRIVILDLEFRLRDTLCVVGFDQATQRFNDGKVDRSGAHFWVGSIYLPRDRKAAGIWRFSYDGSIMKVLDGITTANGIAWSPDGKIMYFADSWHRTIWAADYDAERGEVSRRRPFFRPVPDMGRPDGATVDSEGFYWCAAFGASKLLRISPDGRLDRTVEMPMTRPTMCSFGGNAGDVLFVSSYGGPRHREDRVNDPLAGQVISLNFAVSGPLEAQMGIGAADTAGPELD